MLKENDFYNIINTYVPSLNIEEKKTKIKDLYDFGCEKHILLRINQYMSQSNNSERFKTQLRKLLE
jgi:hypothetical protein